MATKKTTKKSSRSAKSDEDASFAFNVTAHILVPKHELCTDAEKAAVLARYKVKPLQLPRILSSDPAIQGLNAQEGDLIRILRKSPTAGETIFYRIVSAE